ncbi:MAG: hypothetical protein P8J17_06255 [Halioglobus sp.]|jgi:hypothetical protein|nr:hypothetical protein [Halioglobus sp.]
MFKKTALIAGIGLALSVTAQADYQWEVGGFYTFGEFKAAVRNTPQGNRSKDIDENIGGVFGTWYMEEVDTSKGPLREAAFLDHASDITLEYTDGKIDTGKLGPNLNNDDQQTYSVSSRYIAEGPGWKLSGWLVDLGYERADINNSRTNIYNVGVGKYITENTTLVFDYTNIDIGDGGGDADSYELDLDHFFAFDNGGLKANLSYGNTSRKGSDDVDTWIIGGTWYLNNNIGFGAEYINTSLDGSDTVNGYSLDADWFITESFGVNLALTQVDYDNFNFPNGNGKLELEKDEIKLSANFRF